MWHTNYFLYIRIPLLQKINECGFAKQAFLRLDFASDKGLFAIFPQVVLEHRCFRLPIIENAQADFRAVVEDVVAEDKIFGLRAVVVRHDVGAVGVRPLRMGPSVACIDKCIVLNQNVFRDGIFRIVPIFEGIFRIPDGVVSVGNVPFDAWGILIGRTALVRQRRIVDFPDSVVFNETVACVVPKLDAIAKTDIATILRRELMRPADV